MREFLRCHAATFATTSIVLVLYAASLPPRPTAAEQAALAAPFSFQSYRLFPAYNGRPLRSIRTVHPDLAHIDAWISSVGAAVAIADIDDLGRPADLCLVDPRNDSVSVMPAPGTGGRYLPFALPLPSAGYEPEALAPMGCLPVDVNEDGRLDLVVYYWGRTPVVFLQGGEGELAAARFSASELAPSGERWFTNAAVAADIDGDGHVDLVFGNYFADGARILDAGATDPSSMQHSMSRAGNGGRNRLLLWQSAAPASVTFRDASDAFDADMANGWTLALGAADLDGDLRPELYVANDFGSDRLLHNRSQPGRPAFAIVEGRRAATTPRSKVLGRDSFKGMGVDFGDLTGDGRSAIAVSNISEPYALLESHFLFVPTGDDAAWADGRAPYRDDSGRRGTWTGGWGWDVRFADLDNSGTPEILQATGFIKGERDRWPELQELAMANDEVLAFPAAWARFGPGDDLSGHGHDRLYVADPDGIHHDIWPLLGLDRDTVSRGIAVGDVYGDGRLAVAIARQWMPSIVLRNTSARAGSALVLDLRLRGTVAGARAAIGATAQVRLPDGRLVTGRVDGGSGHSGKQASEIHLGLGALPDGASLAVEIAWRDGGGIHRRTFELAPGRHRIVLDAPIREQAAAEWPPQTRRPR